VTARLGAIGFSVTQATVSRDLEQIGAIKVKRGGALAYALPDQHG
jgi:transcriptional regulator of arginine metabolism